MSRYDDHGASSVARVGLDGKHARRSPPAWPAAGSTGPIPAASSAWRAMARSPSRMATRRSRRTSRSRAAAASRQPDPSQRRPVRRQDAGATSAARRSRRFDQRPIDAWIVTPPDFDPAQEVPADPRDPRRTVRGLRPELLDRRSALRGGRLRRGLRQPARLDVLRRGVRQRDRQELSRQRLRRPDERGRRRDRHGSRRPEQSVRHRRLRRRRADRLDRRQDRPLPRRRDAEAGDQLDQLRR